MVCITPIHGVVGLLLRMPSAFYCQVREFLTLRIRLTRACSTLLLVVGLLPICFSPLLPLLTACRQRRCCALSVQWVTDLAKAGSLVEPILGLHEVLESALHVALAEAIRDRSAATLVVIMRHHMIATTEMVGARVIHNLRLVVLQLVKITLRCLSVVVVGGRHKLARHLALVLEAVHLVGDALLSAHEGLVLPRHVVRRPLQLLRAVVRVVALLVAVVADDARNVGHVLRVLVDDHVELLGRQLILLAVGRFVAGPAAPVADELHVHWLLPVRLAVELHVHEVLLGREIRQLLQRQMLQRDHALDVRETAFGAVRAEPKRIVDTDFLEVLLVPVPVVALRTEFAETALIVGARLLLFRSTWVFLRGMAIHACFLLVAMTTLFEKLADRDLVLNVHVEELALVVFAAIVLQPVNAHFLLQLGFVRLGVVRVKHLVYRVERGTTVLHVGAHAEPGHASRSILTGDASILVVC